MDILPSRLALWLNQCFRHFQVVVVLKYSRTSKFERQVTTSSPDSPVAKLPHKGPHGCLPLCQSTSRFFQVGTAWTEAAALIVDTLHQMMKAPRTGHLVTMTGLQIHYTF
jgi:hypothetical protein